MRISVGVGRTRGPRRRIEIDRSIGLVCTAPHHTNGHRKCAGAPDEGVYCDDQGEDGPGKLDSRTGRVRRTQTFQFQGMIVSAFGTSRWRT